MPNSWSFSRNSAGQKGMTGYIYSTEWLYLARISFKIDGEINSFSDKEKLREFSTTKPALQQMLNGLIYSQEIQEKIKDLQNQPQRIKKMSIGTYISIITWNRNGLNAPTKRHRLAEWLHKQDPYMLCTRNSLQT